MRALQTAATGILLSTAALTWMLWPGVPLHPTLKITALLLLILWAVLSSVFCLTFRSGEEDTHTGKERLRSQALAASRAEEEERKRIARHLHDRLGQSLVGLKLELQILREGISGTEAGGQWDRVIERMDDAIEDTRTMTYELCPPILYEQGLEAALEWLVKEFASRHAVEMAFQAYGGAGTLDEERRGFLFQAAREVLSNAVRHAKSRRIETTVRRVNGEIVVEIKDDGMGFNASNQEPGRNTGSGFGLFSIGERLDRLGGQMRIDSSEGMGTEVDLVLPLDPTSGESRKERENVLEGTPG